MQHLLTINAAFYFPKLQFMKHNIKNEHNLNFPLIFLDYFKLKDEILNSISINMTYRLITVDRW